MIIRELVTRLGFDADNQAIRDFDNGLQTVRKTAQAVVVGVTVLTAAVGGLVNSTAAAGDELAKTSDRLGIQINDLEELRFAAERTGVAQGTLDNSLRRVQRRMADARKGTGEAVDALKELRITSQDIEGLGLADQFALIADRVGGVADQGDRQRLMFRLFGRDGEYLFNLMGDGSETMRELREQFRELSGGPGEEAARMAERFIEARINIMTAINGIKDGIATALMPGLIESAEAMTQWIVVNRELIQQRLDRTLEVITRALRFFWSIAGDTVAVMNDLVQYTGGWENTLRLLAFAIAGLGIFRLYRMLRALPTVLRSLRAGFLLLGRALIATPFGAIVTGVTLLLDELWNLRQGNETVIGRVVGDWDNLVTMVSRAMEIIASVAIPIWREFSSAMERVMFIFQPLASAAADMVRAIVALFQGDLSGAVAYWLQSLGHMVDTVKRMGQLVIDALSEVAQGAVNILRQPVEAFIDWFERAVQRIAQAARDAVPDWVRSAAGGVSAAAGTVGRFASDRASDVAGFFGGRSGAQDAQRSSVGGSTTNRAEYNISNDISLSVPQGTPDFQRRILERDAERLVDEAWRRNMRQTISNFPEVE